ncbi:MAG: hypothetical protein VYD90_11125 [Pseudomonadota bacterium]|nr:hypothetical protein [Pseudomonadota bacterium]
MPSPKTYTCLRAMTDNGKNYARGDEIELSDGDAAGLLKIGAIATETHAAAGGDLVELDKLKLEELKAIAEKEEVDLDGITRKADIVAAIKLKRETA